MKIMIVEDDKSIAFGLEYSLRTEQYEPIVCYDAATAKKFIHSQLAEIELCLLDLTTLPDGSGW